MWGEAEIKFERTHRPTSYPVIYRAIFTVHGKGIETTTHKCLTLGERHKITAYKSIQMRLLVSASDLQDIISPSNGLTANHSMHQECLMKHP